MALLPWDSEDDNKDDLFQPQPIKKIASVQSSSWQPAASGADSAVATDDVTQSQPQQGGIFGQTSTRQPTQQSSTPYLVSQEKAQVDQAKRQRDAEIEQARIEQENARRRAEAAAAVAQRFKEGQVRDQQGQKLDVGALKNDNGWKKYYAETFANEKNGMGFWDKLMDGGQASKRAEVIARNKYATELINRAYDDNGNTIDQGAADYARKVTAYNKALAEDNSTRSRALGEAIGAFDKPGQNSLFSWNRLKNAINAEKQMNIGSAVFGVDDTQKTDWRDVGRFGGSLVQGFGTMPVIGAKELYEAGVGRGTDAKTGLQKDLSMSERLGRGASGGLNVVTPFVGGSGKLLDDLTAKVMTNTATAAEKSLLKQAIKRTLLAATEQAGIGAVQSGAEYFSNGDSLLDENGNFDKQKLAEFAKQVGEGGAMSFAGGAILGGAGEGVRAIRQNRVPTLDAGELAALETNATNSGEAQVSANRAANADGAALQALENGDVTPVQAPVADGITTPDAPVTEGPTPVTPEIPTSQNIDLGSNKLDSNFWNPENAVAPADGVSQPTPTEVVPVRDAPAIDQAVPADALPAADAPVPGEVTPATKPVADGTVKPTEVAPVRDTPTVPTEEVRALQDARAGKSQAEEAVINQRVQELTDEIPKTQEQIDAERQRQMLDDVISGRDEIQRRPLDDEPAMSEGGDAFTLDESRGGKETLTWEDPMRTVRNDGADSYRQTSIDNYERVISDMQRSGSSQRHINGIRQNLETLKSSKPNEAYWINPSTGKAELHPASELLGSFSKYIGEDVPPIVIGNAIGEGRVPVPKNYSRANATYMAKLSRLDYKNKNSVYHETMHHIDHFIRGYEGKNPKMLELRKLRDEIPVSEMRAFKLGDDRAENKAEYVAHAMDSLLDGRIKAGQLGKATMRYIKKFFSSVKEALSSGHVYNRSHDGVKIADYVKKLDAVIHDGEAPNQQPLSKKELTPTTKNLPTVMQPKSKGEVTPFKPQSKGKGDVTPVKPKKTTSEWAKRVYSQTDLHKDMKRRLAAALGKEKDAELPIDELLSGTKVSDKDKVAITERYNTLEELSKEFNKLMQGNRKLFEADTPEAIRQGISQLDEVASRRANKLIDAYGRAERDLNGYIRKVQGRRSLAHRGVNALQNVTGARNASLLSSVGGIERNTTQELGANILDAVMHPVKYVKGVPQLVPEVVRAYKRAFREFSVKPKTLSESLPYAIGNMYRVLMAPVTGQANFRKGIMRETLAESLLRAEGLDPSRAEIKKFAGSMGADSEVVANNLAGIMNGMTSHTNGLKVMQDYQKFIHTGSAEAKDAFMRNAERSSNLAAKLSRVGAESDDPKVRAAASLMNIVMPFVTTASNMAKTAVTYNFNPMARSVPDEVLKAVRSNPANTLSLLKANAVKGGVLASVYGLYAAGVVQYNNGDEVDKPKGISIDLGNGEFFPVRGTPIEVPIAAVVTAAMLSDDIADNKVKDWRYYAGILGNSLPYVDSTNNIAAATISGLDAAFNSNADQGTGDKGYAAKSYGINMASSFVPYSNNGINAGVNAWQGKSTNAKSVYDKDTSKWFGNKMVNSYGDVLPFVPSKNTLKDSRDAAGRVRTVDQQGGFRIQKGINDELTKTHNDTIDTLVKYGRENGLGKSTQEMFNTYDTGKNNNFKSIQDTITFLDSNGNPDPAKKLENNEKLADLATQIRDGFYGESGMELLTLDGKELKSDASAPLSKSGNKNTKLPISMQSIKNAIAATDLPKDQNEMLNVTLAAQSSELWDRFKNQKSISYEQYASEKAKIEQQQAEILSNSKNYQKMTALMNKLDEQGFFKAGGLGSTKAGQTYLWNSLNALLGSKGATPAATYPDGNKSFTPWGNRGTGRTSKSGGNLEGGKGVQFSPVTARQLAKVESAKFTPFKVKVKLGNEIKRDRSQNYSDRSF